MDPLPVFREIRTDLQVSAREQVVFWAAVELLDVLRWRRMSVTQLEAELLRQLPTDSKAVPRSTVWTALSGLIDRGYVERSQGEDGETRYRIPVSRERSAPAEAAPAPTAVVSARRPTRRASGIVSEALD